MYFTSWFSYALQKRITSKNVIDATNVPSELGYEYEMWFWFDPFISNKKCAVCITWKGFAKMLHFVPSKNLPSVS